MPDRKWAFAYVHSEVGRARDAAVGCNPAAADCRPIDPLRFWQSVGACITDTSVIIVPATLAL
jgi:hypothetical protein